MAANPREDSRRQAVTVSSQHARRMASKSGCSRWTQQPVLPADDCSTSPAGLQLRTGCTEQAQGGQPARFCDSHFWADCGWDFDNPDVESGAPIAPPNDAVIQERKSLRELGGGEARRVKPAVTRAKSTDGGPLPSLHRAEASKKVYRPRNMWHACMVIVHRVRSGWRRQPRQVQLRRLRQAAVVAFGTHHSPPFAHGRAPVPVQLVFKVFCSSQWAGCTPAGPCQLTQGPPTEHKTPLRTLQEVVLQPGLVRGASAQRAYTQTAASLCCLQG